MPRFVLSRVISDLDDVPSLHICSRDWTTLHLRLFTWYVFPQAQGFAQHFMPRFDFPTGQKAMIDLLVEEVSLIHVKTNAWPTLDHSLNYIFGNEYMWSFLRRNHSFRDMLYSRAIFFFLQYHAIMWNLQRLIIRSRDRSVVLAWRSGSVMDCHATVRGSIPGGYGVFTELHVLRKGQ